MLSYCISISRFSHVQIQNGIQNTKYIRFSFNRFRKFSRSISKNSSQRFFGIMSGV